jgi:hypothetical protein
LVDNQGLHKNAAAHASTWLRARPRLGGAMPAEVIIGAVAVAMDRAAKIDRNKLVQTLGLASRFEPRDSATERLKAHGLSVGEYLLEHLSPSDWNTSTAPAITSAGRTGGWKAGNFDPSDPFSFPNVRFFQFS